jgi:hypothetical protein
MDSNNLGNGSGSQLNAGLPRLNTNSLLFPRNNLVDGLVAINSGLANECNNNLETSESK